jgi:hypothetical protein
LVLVVIVAFFAFLNVSVNAENYGPALAAKVTIEEADGYFILSDGSYWKVVGFVPRTRGLIEWWNDVQLAPDTYKCVPNDWILGVEVIAYPKYGNLGVDEEKASNQDALRQCSYLLVNKANGQVLFASPLDPAVFLTQVFKEAQHSGYDKGYTKGVYERSSINQKEVKKNCDKAYSDGYALGCSERGSVVQEEIKKNCDKAYSEGYALGCSERSAVAKEEGFNRYQAGYNDGYEVGYNDGHQIGIQNDNPPSYDSVVGERGSRR